MAKNLIICGLVFVGLFFLSGSPLVTWAVLLGLYCIGLALLLSWIWGGKDKGEKGGK